MRRRARRIVGRRLMLAGMRAFARARKGVVAEPLPCPAGWATGPPDFVGVGAYRSGTSWWYRLIVDHPEVFGVRGLRRRLRRGELRDPTTSVPAHSVLPPGKELRFFDPFVETEHFPPHAGLYQRFFPRPEGSISGEWSPNYMSDFWIPPLLARVAPNAKLLVLVRDPIDRFRSTLAFVDTVAELRGTRRRVDVWNLELQRSRYHEQLRRLLQYFDRDQILVLQYERCVRDPRAELRRTYDFLGLEFRDHVPASVEQRVAHSRREAPPLSEEMRRLLVAELDHQVQALERDFPEVDIGLWGHFRSDRPPSRVTSKNS